MTALSGVCKSDVSEEGTSCGSDKDSYIGELTKQEVFTGFSELCIKNEERGQIILKQKVLIDQLKAEKEEHLLIIDDLKEEVVLQKSKLDNMTKSIRMLNKSSDVLDEILQVGKNSGDVHGLGFNNQVVNYKQFGVKFVPQRMK